MIEEKIASFLHKYSTVKLSDLQIGSRELMKRQETKFILTQEQLLTCLDLFTNDCSVLVINNNFTHSYKTKYFDTENLESYTDHHRGKSERFKIRKRKYISNGKSFFEIKKRNNKKFINKFRIPSTFEAHEINEIEQQFINTYLPVVNEKLYSFILQNDYNRIVLIDNNRDLRITFDFNISFLCGDNSVHLNNVVIAEFKYHKMPKDYIHKMTNLGVSSTSFSKYCIGTAILNDKVKRNNFKTNLIKIKQWNF